MRAHLIVVAALGACQIPVGQAGPPIALTAGKGRQGAAMTLEVLTRDVFELEAQLRDPAAPDAIPRAPYPSGSWQLSYGLSENLDLEGRMETAVGLLPFPAAVLAGLRYQVARGGDLELATSVHLGFGAGKGHDALDQQLTMTVTRLAGAAVAGWRVKPWLRPGLMLAATPSLVYAKRGESAERYALLDGNASLTLAFISQRFEIVLFGTAGVFDAPSTGRGSSFRASAGISWVLRQD